MADVITRFKLETTQYDSKLRDASKQLSDLTNHLSIAGKDFDKFAQKSVESARALGSIEGGANNTKEKVRELVRAFNEVANAYNSLTKEQQQSDFGKAMSDSLQQLQGRIQTAKQELYGLGDAVKNKGAFGQFGGVIDTLGHKIGIAGNLTDMLTSKTALMTAGIGASVAMVYKATQAWTSYNQEIGRQDQQTQVITGLKGKDAERMTSAARALASTYNVDVRQSIEAANTLMSQFGATSEESIRLLRDGLQGMIYGDGPKLLQMIQQYAPAFRDAGVSASQLVAVIHNTEGGLFTDQNMNAIVMGMKNIRLMTKQTSDALSQLGIDGRKMSQELNSGTLTVFDALKQVAEQLQTVDSNSKTAGEVMQQVFGRSGVTAGTNLAKAIEELNTNLAETKTQTGELGESFVRLERASEELESALRETFGFDGWEQMGNGIKTYLISALTNVLELVNAIGGVFGDLFSLTAGSRPTTFSIPEGPIDPRFAALQDIEWSYMPKPGDPYYSAYLNSPYYSAFLNNPYSQPDQRQLQFPPGLNGQTQTVTVEADTTPALQSIRELREEITRLNDLRDNATSDSERRQYLSQIQSLRSQLNVMNGGTGGSSGAQKIKGGLRGLSQMGDDAITVTESMNELNAQLQMYRRKLAQATNMFEAGAAQQGIERTQAQIASQPMALRWGMDTDEYMRMNQDIIQQMKDVIGPLQKMDIDKSGKKFEEDKEDKSLADVTSKLGSGLSGITGGLEALGIDLGDGFKSVVSGIQGVTSILMGISAVVQAIEMIQAVSSAIPFFASGGVVHAANGFIVPGRKYSGDQIPAMLNSGETVLNAGQSDHVASAIRSAESTANMLLGTNFNESIVTGEEIEADIVEIRKILDDKIAQTILDINSKIQEPGLFSRAFSWFFATGGVVHAANGWAGTIPGNSYSGDNIPIMANAGEVVLTRAMAGNLASQLQGGGLGGQRLEAIVTGEQLKFVLRNNSLRWGRGEYITSKFS